MKPSFVGAALLISMLCTLAQHGHAHCRRKWVQNRQYFQHYASRRNPDYYDQLLYHDPHRHPHHDHLHPPPPPPHHHHDNHLPPHQKHGDVSESYNGGSSRTYHPHDPQPQGPLPNYQYPAQQPNRDLQSYDDRTASKLDNPSDGHTSQSKNVADIAEPRSLDQTSQPAGPPNNVNPAASPVQSRAQSSDTAGLSMSASGASAQALSGSSIPSSAQSSDTADILRGRLLSQKLM